MREVGGADPGSPVCDGDFQSRFHPSGLLNQSDGNRLAGGAGFDRVLQDVEQHLFQLIAIGLNGVGESGDARRIVTCLRVSGSSKTFMTSCTSCAMSKANATISRGRA